MTHLLGHRVRPALAFGLVLAVTMLAGTAAAASAAPPAASGGASPDGTSVGVQQIITGLDQPVFVTNAGDSRLFVVERTGKILILRRVSGTWQVSGTFLDIRNRIVTSGGEQGLLGLAFPHDYATSGLFYVYYVNRHGNEVIAEYQRATKSKADPTSRRQLLTIRDPFTNHNGGWIAFRPSEPYLYAAEGDGGSGGDPGNRAQNIHTLLGKILRIDPRDPDGAGPKHYSVPSSNPFVGRDGKDEIYAYGLRNPWRDSFDALTGDLWIGDVGQDRFEEVDHVSSGNGVNFGWNLIEGRHRYPSGSLCEKNCKHLPVIEYKHVVAGADNCAVTGGYVSRRQGAPLYGQYVFGDFCSGRIWNVPATYSGTHLPKPLLSNMNISSFGVGNSGYIYVVDLNGSISLLTGS